MEEESDGGSGGSEAVLQHPPRARRIVSAVLVVVTALLSIGSLLGGYVRGDLLTTDRYVAIVGPLARNPAVQAQVVDSVTAAVVDGVRVDQLTQDALEVLRARDDRLGQLLSSDRRLARAVNGLLSGFGPLLQNQLEAATRRAAERVVHSDRFADLWTQANRRGHAAALAALRDEGSALRTDDGNVRIDLGVIVAAVKQRLLDDGLTIATLIPTTDRQLVLVRSAELAQAQAGLRVVDGVAPWLPWLTLVCAAAAVAVSPGRRRALQGLGAGLAIAMGVVALVLTLGRGVVLDQVASTAIAPAAAAAIVDAVLAPLWPRIWLLLVISVLIALVAWFSGPGGGRVRAWVSARRARSAPVATR